LAREQDAGQVGLPGKDVEVAPAVADDLSGPRLGGREVNAHDVVLSEAGRCRPRGLQVAGPGTGLTRIIHGPQRGTVKRRVSCWVHTVTQRAGRTAGQELTRPRW